MEHGNLVVALHKKLNMMFFSLSINIKLFLKNTGQENDTQTLSFKMIQSLTGALDRHNIYLFVSNSIENFEIDKY